MPESKQHNYMANENTSIETALTKHQLKNMPESKLKKALKLV